MGLEAYLVRGQARIPLKDYKGEVLPSGAVLFIST
jgi:hypothetical protein